MMAQARAEEDQRRREARMSNQPGAAGAAGRQDGGAAGGAAASNEGWGAWASRQLNERTERLNVVGDSMDNLSNNSKGWADDVNKFVAKQKRGLVTGAIKSKFGL